MKTPLIYEEYPEWYTGLPFITLINYNGIDYLTIVDDNTPKTIKAYVLDKCNDDKKLESVLLSIAASWCTEIKYPISVEFSKIGISDRTAKLHMVFNKDNISRIIGPAPAFEMHEKLSIKRRRKKVISKQIKVTKRTYPESV